MKCLHISDTHFLVDYFKNKDVFEYALQTMKNPIEVLKEYLQKIDVSIDFVVHTGDLTHDGSLLDYEQLKMYFDEIFGDIPVFVTAGNHDDLALVKEVFLQDKEALFEVNKKEDYTVLTFYTAELHGNEAEITKEMSSQLLQYVETHLDEKIILATHHHFLEDQFEMARAHIDTMFFEIIEKPNVVAILNGHTHHSYIGEICGVPYSTAPSLSFKVDRTPEDKLEIREGAGVHIIDFEDSYVKITPIIGEERILGMM